jgi:hypothetical protein
MRRLRQRLTTQPDTASGVIAPPQRHLQRFTRVSTLIFVSLPCLFSADCCPHVMVR